MYLLHRYQMAAVAKALGGLYFTPAVKGDGQVAPRPPSSGGRSTRCCASLRPTRQICARPHPTHATRRPYRHARTKLWRQQRGVVALIFSYSSD